MEKRNEGGRGVKPRGQDQGGSRRVIVVDEPNDADVIRRSGPRAVNQFLQSRILPLREAFGGDDTRCLYMGGIDTRPRRHGNAASTQEWFLYGVANRC